MSKILNKIHNLRDISRIFLKIFVKLEEGFKHGRIQNFLWGGGWGVELLSNDDKKYYVDSQTTTPWIRKIYFRSEFSEL